MSQLRPVIAVAAAAGGAQAACSAADGAEFCKVWPNSCT
jgi:hypothetical protein